MRTLTLCVTPLALAAVAAWALVPRPAGACDYDCLGETIPLTLVEVKRVEGDGEPPEWAEDAILEANADGVPAWLTVDGVSEAWFYAEEEG